MQERNFLRTELTSRTENWEKFLELFLKSQKTMKNTLKIGLLPFSQEQTFFEMEFQSQFSYNIALYH